MDDLAGRVHAAVGAACADRDDGLPRHEGQCRLHGILDGGAVVLRLPAGVFGAVIFDDGGDTMTNAQTVS
jgi:hypothetical protein